MEKKTEDLIRRIVQEHNTMTLATVRGDGYPQATTVGYASDGLALYVVVGSESQKARNIRACEKVSLTIDHVTDDWNALQGLSMGAVAQIVADPQEIERVLKLIAAAFPQMASMPEVDPAAAAIVKITPKVISVLDYTQGFGHTELVTV